MPTLLFLFLLLLLSPSSHSRKLLQDPFFPAKPPANSPFSKYPFSSDSPPFFPQLPSPPPPPLSSSNQPTFPANLSSLLFPNSPSSSPPRHPSSPAKLAAAILLPLLFLSLLSLSLTFFLLRRRRSSSRSSSPKKPSFSPQNHRRPSSSSSPELRPLPPLTRQLHARRSSHSEEEFYSPADSSSSSHKVSPAPAPATEPCPSLSTTPSYPSSSSSDPRSPKIRSRSSSGEMPLASPVEKKPDLEKSSSFDDLDQSSQAKPAAVAPPPPPPPPMPRAGYWESKIRRPVLKDASSVVVVSAKAIESSDFGAADLCLERNEEIQRPKLKPLHWDKVRASSDRAMVWDQLKSSSFQVNEEMIESLFVCNGTSSKSKETSKQQVVPLPKQEKRPVLDPKKSQNIAILLRALNVTKEEVCDALLEGNTESLGTELLDTLLKMAPSKEEEDKLREYNDDSPVKLGPAEKFLKALLDIPFAFKRVDAMLYIINFDSEVNYLKKSFETLEMACEELRNSRLFLKLLEAVLKTGNRMNVGTNRGDARSFKLDTLLKLVDVKGTDGKTTLLHFVVQEVIRAEGSRLSASTPSSAKTQSNTLRDDLECRRRGLQVIAGLGGELSNVKKSASMDSEVLSSYVSKLAGGISKVGEVLKLKEEAGDGDSSSSSSSSSFQKFHEAMRSFMKKAEDEIIKVQAQESVALSLVKEITEYFHGNSAKEEAHPFRIFMVVRDFLCILDQVCKEVGKITDRTIASSTRQFPVPVNPTLPSLFPKLRALRPESSDDDGSASPLSS